MLPLSNAGLDWLSWGVTRLLLRNMAQSRGGLVGWTVLIGELIIDLLAAATGYAVGPEARENLRRIKFNLVSERTGVGLEPLGE